MRYQQQGNFFKQKVARLPPYILIPAIGVPGSFLCGYWYFQDEAPFTRRKRLLATSPEWERRLGDQEYRRLLKQYKNDKLPESHRASVTVRRVGERIANAAKNFARETSRPELVSGSTYTYTVVRSEMANAFVLPNNHVFVLTGLFRHVKDEDELAAILGHEMAHNLARHAGERMSSSILINIIARATLLFDSTGFLYSIFLPAATLLHDLPHSREHEVEADYIGLHLAADACYDPRAAKRVFNAMKHDHEGQNPPEFISTHPSYSTRISNFDSWMHDAMAKFNNDGGLKCQTIRRDMKSARQAAAKLAKIRERNGSGR